MTLGVSVLGVSALGVAVGVPREHAAGFAHFPAHDDRVDGPFDVVLESTDPVAMSGAFTTAVVERTAALTVHAGVVSAGDGGAIVVPGRSGLGKSTLTAALVQQGFGYLSDEVLAVSRDDGLITSFPRPITLDAGSLAVLGLPSSLVGDGCTEAVVALEALGAVGPASTPPAAIVLARRVTGSAVSVERGSPADATAALIDQSFNHFRDPASSLRTIARLVGAVEVLNVTYGDAPAAAARLARLFPVARS